MTLFQNKNNIRIRSTRTKDSAKKNNNITLNYNLPPVKRPEIRVRSPYIKNQATFSALKIAQTIAGELVENKNQRRITISSSSVQGVGENCRMLTVFENDRPESSDETQYEITDISDDLMPYLSDLIGDEVIGKVYYGDGEIFFEFREFLTDFPTEKHVKLKASSYSILKKYVKFTMAVVMSQLKQDLEVDGEYLFRHVTHLGSGVMIYCNSPWLVSNIGQCYNKQQITNVIRMRMVKVY